MSWTPFFALLFLALASAPLLAQLPVARLTNAFPAGGRSGSTVEVTIAGADLDEPVGLHFSAAGITGTVKDQGPKYTVTIATNISPGVYEARFVGRFGISNPRAFVVGLLPETVVPGTNSTIETACPLALGTSVNARALVNGVSWFKFHATKSQRLLIECLSEEIDSRLEPSLEVSDSRGHKLEHSRSGGLLDFIAPADGTYVLRLSDILYRGGDDYFYRLTVSTSPRVDFVLPLAGLPGTKTNCVFYGRNLPGGKPARGWSINGKPLEQLSLEVTFPPEAQAARLETLGMVRPAGVGLDSFLFPFHAADGRLVLTPLGIALAPVVVEREPNDEPAHAQKLDPPCEVDGQFARGTDRDWFTFQAKKGEVLWIEVLSQRYGLPTDPFVLVQRVKKNDKGEEQITDVLELYDDDNSNGDPEFNTASRDPAARFEASEDGTYRVLLRDLFRRAEGPPCYYRLSLRRETPDFRLVALAMPPPKLKADAKNIEIAVPLLRRGETLPLRIVALRQDGFAGDIELSIENPPPGLRFDGARILAGKNSAQIFLTAALDAPAFAGPFRLVGKAKAGARELVREVRGVTLVNRVESYDQERPEMRYSRDLTLALSDKETAPISIVPTEQKTWTCTTTGKLQVAMQIVRRGDYTASLKLKPVGPGTPAALKEFEVDAKLTNTTFTLELEPLKLEPGTHVFTWQSLTTGKYQNNPEAAAFASAAAKEADRVSQELAAAAKKAGEEFEQMAKAAQDAEASAKIATEKLATAKAALDKNAADDRLTAEHNAALKAMEEATAASKSGASRRETASQAKAAAEAKAKEAQTKKETTAARAKEAEERAKPKEVTFFVYATPIKIQITPAEQTAAKK